jgi:hypothetical protein
MVGTFRAGDLLIIVPVSWDALAPGDVIAFRRAGPGKTDVLLCHRVVARTEAGLVTRGDAQAVPDPGPVPSQDLVGRVALVRRDGRDLPVVGGLPGRAWAALLDLRRRLLPLARSPYRWLRASRLLNALWHPRIVEVHLAVGDEPLVKYLHRGRTVAQLWPRQDRFWCRKPYDLVIENPLDR